MLKQQFNSRKWRAQANKNSASTGQDRFIRMDEVKLITGLSKSAIYRGIEEGIFPPPTKIGKKSIAWRLSVIEGWMDHVEQAEG